MSEVSFIREFGEVNPEFLFHGTTYEAAVSLTENKLLEPLIIQADRFLREFGFSYSEFESDDEYSEMRSFMFERQRQDVLSTATKFSLARSYAIRAPEWRYYLTSFVHGRNGGSSETWTEFAGKVSNSQSNPAILVIRTSSPRAEVVPEFIRPNYVGREVECPNPLPAGFQFQYLIELDRHFSAQSGGALEKPNESNKLEKK